MAEKNTKEEFIKKAKEVHSDKFNYSKVEYINNKTHVILICNKCGCEFKVRPDNHIHGTDCPSCGHFNRVNNIKRTKGLTNEEFINNMKYIYEDKYDYSLVEYVNYSTKISVICNNCGKVFLVTPANHSMGHGCSFCKKSVKKNLNDIKEQLIELNNNLTILSEEYINKKIPLKVKCSICETEFNRLPNSLLSNPTCPHCSLLKRSKARKNNVEDIIKRAKETHGEKYDYSNVKYINYHTPICIICPIHGEFYQKPGHHLSGQGCPKCANKNVTTEEWIEKARLVHGDKYDYSKAVYKNNRTKVTIICPKHGEFKQTPEKHLADIGCPICNESKLEKIVNNILRENNITLERQKKFSWLGQQSLDFYLPKYNLAIECQGIQHFKSVKHFGGQRRFKIDLNRDIKKCKLCMENNINLLYFSNNDIDIDEIINNEIFENIYNSNNFKYVEEIQNIINENIY